MSDASTNTEELNKKERAETEAPQGASETETRQDAGAAGQDPTRESGEPKALQDAETPVQASTQASGTENRVEKTDASEVTVEKNIPKSQEEDIPKPQEEDIPKPLDEDIPNSPDEDADSDAEPMADRDGAMAETPAADADRENAADGSGMEDGAEDSATDDERLRDTGHLSHIVRKADKAEKKERRRQEARKNRESLGERAGLAWQSFRQSFRSAFSRGNDGGSQQRAASAGAGKNGETAGKENDIQSTLYTPEENEADRQRFLRTPAHMISYAIVIGLVLLAVFLISFISGHWKYKGYRVISSRTQEATVSANYCSVDGDILRYSTDGASLLDSSGEILWDVSYSMNSPDVAIRGKVIAIYDAAGSDMIICDRSGQIGSASASYPIKKADVSADGNVAAIEEDGSTTYIEYYAVDGTQIAEIKTSMDNPGYPLDLAVSEDGELLAVSYLAYEGSTQKDLIDVYSFGSAGQNQMDNRIGEFEYTDRIIPELVYLNGSMLAAFADNGFMIFSGANVPEEKESVQIEDQIYSIFHDNTHIGMITGTGDSHRLIVYTTSGRKTLDKSFTYAYTDMDYVDEEITLYNNNSFCVYNLSGVCKFDGSYTGSIVDIFSIGRYRYGVVKEASIDQIQLR